MYGDDDLLALSGLQHLAFCERQWALIHIEGEWLDNSETVTGNIFHERVDAVGYHTRDGVTSHRRIRLYSHELGLYGIADIVETETGPDGSCSVVPVEYKVGRPKAGDWDRLQVAAQAMCLEEMWSVDVWQGAIFYGKTRRRETFSIDEDLRTMARDLAARMHDLQARGVTPRCESTSRTGRPSQKYLQPWGPGGSGTARRAWVPPRRLRSRLDAGFRALSRRMGPIGSNGPGLRR